MLSNEFFEKRHIEQQLIEYIEITFFVKNNETTETLKVSESKAKVWEENCVKFTQIRKWKYISMLVWIGNRLLVFTYFRIKFMKYLSCLQIITMFNMRKYLARVSLFLLSIHLIFDLFLISYSWLNYSKIYSKFPIEIVFFFFA